jgi:subtilisin family serine protease
MDDQNAASPVSRRRFLGGGVAALTAAAAAPIAFNYASRGHGDWWPDHVAHAEHADDPSRHYHYVRDQLVVAQDDLSQLRRALGHRAGVEATASLDELGLVLVQLHGARGGVPELVDRLHHGRDRAALWAAPNHVLGPCTHAHLSGSIPQPTTESLAPVTAGAGPPAGTGVTVAVLDSGAALGHPWFAGRVDGEVEEPALDARGRLQCNSGHGTFVAGMVLRRAPGARVTAYQVFDDGMIVDDFAVARRLLDLAASDAKVVNLSIGGYTHDDLGMVAISAALRHLFQRRPDIVVVAAAGNDATNKPCFPAADHRVVAVGAVLQDRSGRWRRACFSNYGPWVDACAPGVGLLSTFVDHDGPLVPNEVLTQCLGQLGGEDRMPAGRFTGWARWSGTSFAAPVMAAEITVAIAEGRSGPEAVRHVLHAPGAVRLENLGTVVP